MDQQLPAVRAVDFLPVEENGERAYVVKDPVGLLDEPLVLNPIGGWLIQFFDGQHQVDDVLDRAEEELGEPIPEEIIDELTEILDDHYLLDNQRFQQAHESLKKSFQNKDVRPATLSGESLPESREETTRFLDNLLEVPPDNEPEQPPGGLIIPHIDFERGKSVYERLIPHIQQIQSPERFVILGVSHQFCDVPISLTDKDYGTALGSVAVDSEAVERIQRSLPYSLEEGEIAHRREHSIEIPLTLLKYALTDSDFSIVPVICSFHHDDPFEGNNRFSETLESILSDPNTYLVGGVDFAHVGPQFGDPQPVNEEKLQTIEDGDRTMIDIIEQGHTDDFQEHIQSTGNERAVCGYPAIRTMLPHVESARTVHYDQWEDPNGTVSFGGAVLQS